MLGEERNEKGWDAEGRCGEGRGWEGREGAGGEGTGDTGRRRGTHDGMAWRGTAQHVPIFHLLQLLLLVRRAVKEKGIFLWPELFEWSPVFCGRTSSHFSCEKIGTGKNLGWGQIFTGEKKGPLNFPKVEKAALPNSGFLLGSLLSLSRLDLGGLFLGWFGIVWDGFG